jgi:SWI/SNF-related matrix-associated actin-dependent regulator 1 of chromatin subfamily A
MIWMKDQKTGKAKQKQIWHFDGASNTDELQRKLRETVMVRRLKADVLTELPPKSHQIIELPCNGLQRLVEEELRIESNYQAKKVGLENLRDAARVAGIHDTFEKACSELKKEYNVYFGAMAKLAHDIAVAKLPKIIEYCLEILEGEEKLAVFCHHHDVVFGLEKAFKEAGIEAVRLTGMENKDEKEAAVVAFQGGSARVFIGSLQAAQVGITITKACRAVMAELDWTPGVMDQAADRLHRITQERSVLITYIVLENSLDAKKIGTLIRKRQIVRSIMDDST